MRRRLVGITLFMMGAIAGFLIASLPRKVPFRAGEGEAIQQICDLSRSRESRADAVNELIDIDWGRKLLAYQLRSYDPTTGPEGLVNKANDLALSSIVYPIIQSLDAKPYAELLYAATFELENDFREQWGTRTTLGGHADYATGHTRDLVHSLLCKKFGVDFGYDGDEWRRYIDAHYRGALLVAVPPT